MAKTKDNRKLKLHFVGDSVIKGTEDVDAHGRTEHIKTYNITLPQPPKITKKKVKKGKVAAILEREFDLRAKQYDGLSQDLKQLGFIMPASHLSRLLDSVYRQNLQIGIRTPNPKDARHLPSKPDEEGAVFADESGDFTTLSANKIFLQMKNLIEIRRYLEDQTNRASNLILCLIDPLVNEGAPKITGAKQGQQEAVLKQAADDLIIAILQVLSSSWLENIGNVEVWKNKLQEALGRADGKKLEAARLSLFGLSPPSWADTPKQTTPTKIVDHSGLCAASQTLHLYSVAPPPKNSEKSVANNHVGPTVKIPIALALEGNKLKPLKELQADTEFSAGAMPLTEGYHLYRLAPPEGDGNVSQQSLNMELQRDHLLQSADFRKTFSSEPQDDEASSLFAPLNLTLSTSLEENDRVKSGALLFTAPTAEHCDIYFFHNKKDLNAGLHQELFQSQTDQKHLNLIALSTVSYMCGEAYTDPSYIMKKIRARFSDLKLVEKAALSIAGASVVAVTALTGGGTLVVAGVGLGVIAFKRLFSANYIDNPLSSLKSKDFMKDQIELLGGKDINSVENAPEELTEAELEKQAKATFKDETKLLINGDVGDILRRAFVHLHIASHALKKAKINKKPKDQPQHLAETLHHLQKGWRYLGPSAMFFRSALREYKDAKEVWAEVSPDAALDLIQHFLALQKSGKLPQDPDELFNAIGEMLRPKEGKKTSLFSDNKNRVAPMPEDPQKIAAIRLDEFKQSMDKSNTASAKSKLRPEQRAPLPDGALYAQWQIRGGEIEPYPLSQKHAGRTAKGGRMIMAEAHKLMNMRLALISDKISTREELFNAVTAEPDKKIKGNRVVHSPKEPDPHSAEAKLYEAVKKTDVLKKWQKANSEPFKSMLSHSIKNYSYRTTNTEKAISAVTFAGQMATGMWINLGFGSFADTMSFKATGKYGQFFEVNESNDGDDENVSSGSGDDDSSSFMADTNPVIKWGNDIGNFVDDNQGDIENSAANAAATGSATVAAEFIVTKLSSYITDNHKAETMEKSELLSSKSEAIRIRDKFVTDFVVDPEHADKKTKDDSADDIKAMSAYVGRSAIKSLGGGMRKWHDARQKILKNVRSDYVFSEPSKKGKKTDKKKGDKYEFSDKEIKSGLAEITLRVAQFAKFYSEMASLEANFVVCLTYLDMISEIASSIEAETFTLLDLKGLDPDAPMSASSGGHAHG